MLHGYESWPYLSPEPPPPPDPYYGPGHLAVQLAALQAEVRHLIGWAERLTELHESSRHEAAVFQREAERHRSLVLERLERLARLEERTREHERDEAPSWGERLKAAKEVLTAGGWLVAAAIGVAKAWHWISPETAAWLAGLVGKGHAP